MTRAHLAYLTPTGLLARAAVDLSAPRLALPLPPAPPVVVPPQPLPDIPWTTDPHGVVEDIWPWIRDNATALSPDGAVAWILKSDEVNVEGQTCGEHWDHDAQYVGHLEDSSTGYRWWAAGKKRVNAIDWVNLGEPEPWASLPLERNYFNAGARLWLPRRCVTGYVQTYRTDINWTPSGEVWRNIHMEIRVDVGYARFGGREAFVRGYYIPGGNAEGNYYGPTGWVKHIPAGSK